MTLEEVQALQAEELARISEAGRDGEEVLKRHPDYARFKLQIVQEIESIYQPMYDRFPKPPGGSGKSPERLECALTFINIWGGAFSEPRF
jgi:hypothetical protein